MKINWVVFATISMFFIVSIGQSQTTEWAIKWNKNAESDTVDHYNLYRSTVPGASNQLAQVPHNSAVDTVVYIDSNLEKGVRYYYRVKAVNASNVSSGFSQEVSAAIPLISFTNQVIDTAQSTITINLDDFVSDPDHNDNELVWESAGSVGLSVSIANRMATILKNSPDWSGSELIPFTVSDPTGFTDTSNLRVTSSAGGIVDVEPAPIAFPVPFVADEHSEILFRDLPDSGELLIYDLLGNLVFKTDFSGGLYNWDVRNKAAKAVGAGVFIYMIRDDNNKKIRSNKIVIIR